MKNILIIFALVVCNNISLSNNEKQSYSIPYSVIRTQVMINANNISTWVQNTGTFNQDIRTTNTPGFEWPKGSGKFAIFTAGLSMGAYVNGGLRLATISYNGEYAPGYSNAGMGYTDLNFKIYKVKKGDNAANNPDYANWGLMVPYGAPYIDIDGNGQFNPLVDKPGVKGAGQTIYQCITDGFPENHTTGEGFGGGTIPLYSEMHFTAWSYDSIPQLADVQFIKMEVTNKNTLRWDSTFFGIVCDPDVGNASDDYIGCDLSRNLGYCYNGTDHDGNGTGNSYGLHPPAVGIDLVKGAHSIALPQSELGMTSFVYFNGTGSAGIACETDPSSQPITPYNYLKGTKKDGTPWVNASTMQITKFCYPGDPETNTGWTEYSGVIKNCGGITTGVVETSPPGDRRFILNSGSLQLHVAPLDTQTFVIAQMIARGNTNKNSVTKLKQLSDVVQTFYNNNYTIGIAPISTTIPNNFSLHQNYPNPFNPTTNIKFEIPQSDFINLSVYDLNGKLIEEIVNENISAGTYEVKFSAKNLSSGIYCYRLKSTSFTEMKKMILVK